ncbi:MAG: ImmA/IrrE family metallo-endopeptidase [Hyphomonadaceae bacterium]|nr:ImmA/IrrE family metallo-endopeptidase [Hyphomonadaceae bacterium]
MMELADVGQPTKIAHEIHRQLRARFGSVPRRMPLSQLASAVGIEGIALFDGTSFEGTLVLQDGRAAIGIRKGMRSGRHNFTLAHEIGHFLIPTHRLQRQRFLCETVDMRRVRGGNFSERPEQERIEVEANEFAAALVVPMPEYGMERKALGSACDIAHVRQLAETFDVSQEVMAKIYVLNTDEKAAIITSKGGVVQRVIPQPGFPFLGLKKGALIPNAAVTRSFGLTTANDPISELREVASDIWLERSGNVSAIYEQVFVQEEGWAMTLLLVDEQEDDDEADDRNWNRRSSRYPA